MNPRDQFVREKCVTANPEIVELKFGCLVSWRKGTFYFGGRRKKGKSVLINKSGLSLYSVSSHEYRIIGRSLRLADILLAIIEKMSVGDLRGFNINSYGEFFLGDDAKGSWNLRADDYDLQTEECKNFIANMLGYKE